MAARAFPTTLVYCVAGIVATTLYCAGAALAQEAVSAPPASAAETACFVGPAKLSDADVQAFLASPVNLLSGFPIGGLPMSTRVRSLAGSDAKTLEPIAGLIANATPAQVSSIGSGLARVARACQTANPEYAATVQELVASLDNDALETAFTAASQEVQTAAVGSAAAVGGGGATGGSAIGGGGTAGGGSAGADGSDSTPNFNDAFSVSGGGGSTFAETQVVSPN